MKLVLFYNYLTCNYLLSLLTEGEERPDLEPLASVRIAFLFVATNFAKFGLNVFLFRLQC